MSATLLLVAALCSEGEGSEKICTYMDVTVRMQVQSDAHCFVLADIGNEQNLGRANTPRYSCLPVRDFLALLGETDDRNMGVL